MTLTPVELSLAAALRRITLAEADGLALPASLPWTDTDLYADFLSELFDDDDSDIEYEPGKQAVVADVTRLFAQPGSLALQRMRAVGAVFCDAAAAGVQCS